MSSLRAHRRWLVSGLGRVVLISALASADAAGQRPSDPVIDSLVIAELEARPMAGIEVAVVRGADTLYWRSHGRADLEHDVPLDRDGVFQIASITKQFTAAAVLRLVEDGVVALDDDIRTYLPELRTGDHVVRIRHMLNHTSGLPNIYQMTSWPEIRPLRLLRPEARRLEMAGVAEDSLDFAPGTDFRYSNTGYDLLGDMIEAITGEDVESHFRKELFEPLGLERTSFCPWTRILPNRVWGYEPDSTGSFLENARRQAQGVLYTSGGMCSTAGDLLRWSEALHNGRVLSRESHEAMTTPQGAARTYAFGLYARDLEGHRRLEHNGYTPGFSTQLEHYPDDSLTIVVLANSPARVRTLAEDIAREVLGLGPRPVAVRPEGWRLQAFRSDADTSTTHFRTMGPGMHLTTGPGAIYYHPDSVAQGTDGVEATLIGFGDSGPDEGHGLLFGGTDLQTSGATYLAFLVRRSGEYTLIRHVGDARQTIVPWRPSAAINTVASAGNTLAVNVSTAEVELSINGRSVERLPRTDVGDTGGTLGLWIGADDDVHVNGFRRVR